MNYNKEHWNADDYKTFITELNFQVDTKFQTFQQALIPTGKPVLGIRTPILKKIAKTISKGNYIEFLKEVKPDSHEEITLYGFVISYLKIPFEEILILLDKFIPMIDNWAINDLVAVSLKCFKNNQERGFTYIQTLLNSDSSWHIRFGLVLLLSHYINDDYITRILELVDSVSNDDYYVKMSNAWLLSICYIKYKEQTDDFLTRTKIDDWTYRKTISKICDSHQISKEEKIQLRKRKR